MRGEKSWDYYWESRWKLRKNNSERYLTALFSQHYRYERIFSLLNVRSFASQVRQEWSDSLIRVWLKFVTNDRIIHYHLCLKYTLFFFLTICLRRKLFICKESYSELSTTYLTLHKMEQHSSPKKFPNL